MGRLPDFLIIGAMKAGIASGFRQTFAMSAFYRRLVRPLLPLGTRNSLRNMVAPKPPPRPAPPSYATIEPLFCAIPTVYRIGIIPRQPGIVRWVMRSKRL